MVQRRIVGALAVSVFCALGAALGCGGTLVTAVDASADGAVITPDGAVTTPDGAVIIPDSATPTDAGRAPKLHRATATACSETRATRPDPETPEAGGGPPVDCRTHAECTSGRNGRCDGNGHDGWRCTYDVCTSDAQCGGAFGVCACNGGFRSDNHVCLTTSNCRVDRDCGGGAGYCSPSLGSCGHYTPFVGYFCHTPADTCVDDEDCTGQGQFGQKPYCAFDPKLGHFACSTQECAG